MLNKNNKFNNKNRNYHKKNYNLSNKQTKLIVKILKKKHRFNTNYKIKYNKILKKKKKFNNNNQNINKVKQKKII